MINVTEEYNKKHITAEEIAKQVKPGWVCCSDIGVSIPYALLDTIGKNLLEEGKRGITMHAYLEVGPVPAYKKELAGNFNGVTWFAGGFARKAVNEGYVDVMPCDYQDMPALFRDYVDIDALFLEAAPMDKHGYFSAGVNGSLIQLFTGKARHIYLEVNDQMPRAICGPQIHISQVTAFCEHNAPLPASKPGQPDEISTTIGNIIADEIPNSATIQLGIGAIPDAVGLALRNKHDLGIHTELFTDSMVTLIECGAVTNMNKPIHKGHTVATLSFGSKNIYDFIDDNPSIELLPVSYVNNPTVIAQHPNFMSVNSALEVDFYGQVCAESIGTRVFSGSGGQLDYVRGAVASNGGKSFIAFPSTTQGDTISKIKATLTPGALITTGKNEIDYIVTEYGLAKLRGKTLSQRAKALISIAHPKFRDELTAAARKENIII